MENIIDIHPFDMHAMLGESDELIDVIRMADPERRSELFRIKGQLYRPTVCVAPLTDEGKKMASEIF